MFLFQWHLSNDYIGGVWKYLRTSSATYRLWSFAAKLSSCTQTLVFIRTVTCLAHVARWLLCLVSYYFMLITNAILFVMLSQITYHVPFSDWLILVFSCLSYSCVFWHLNFLSIFCTDEFSWIVSPVSVSEQCSCSVCVSVLPLHHQPNPPHPFDHAALCSYGRDRQRALWRSHFGFHCCFLILHAHVWCVSRKTYTASSVVL